MLIYFWWEAIDRRFLILSQLKPLWMTSFEALLSLSNSCSRDDRSPVRRKTIIIISIIIITGVYCNQIAYSLLTFLRCYRLDRNERRSIVVRTPSVVDVPRWHATQIVYYWIHFTVVFLLLISLSQRFFFLFIVDIGSLCSVSLRSLRSSSLETLKQQEFNGGAV